MMILIALTRKGISPEKRIKFIHRARNKFHVELRTNYGQQSGTIPKTVLATTNLSCCKCSLYFNPSLPGETHQHKASAIK
jgi:hypothetical protein